MPNISHHAPPERLITPHDTDAERAVLACAIQQPDRTIPVIAQYTQTNSNLFFSELHKRVWSHLARLHQTGKQIDLITLQSAMAGSEVKNIHKTGPGKADHITLSTDLETIGGPATLAQLATDSVTPAMFPGYLQICREMQLRRDLISQAESAITAAHKRDLDLATLLTIHNAATSELKSNAIHRATPEPPEEKSVLLLYLETIHPGPRNLPPLFVILGDTTDEETRISTALRAASLFAVSEREISRLSSDPRITSELRKNWIILCTQSKTREADAISHTQALIDYCPRIGQTTVPIAETLTAIGGKKRIDAPETYTETHLQRIRHQMHYTAEAAVIDPDILYAGLVWPGPRGGIHLHEDILARRTSKTQRLAHIGGEFWEWNRPGIKDDTLTIEQPGTWTMITQGKPEIARRFRDIIRAHKSIGGIDPTEVITGQKIDSVVKLATSDRPLSPEILNTHNPMLINTKSGMVHALEETLSPHREEHFSTTQVPVIISGQKAKCPNWLDWLKDQQPDEANARQIQEIFGYCLVPAINYHKFFFWHGDGGTGKSTAANVLIYLIGKKNVSSLRLEDMDNGHARMKLVGKPLYYVPEVNAKTFQHDDLIKAITSGDPVDIDPKYGKPYTYIPKGRLLLTSNLVAHSGDTTLGFMRRFLQINWENVIPEEKKIYGFEEKYFLPELPGIFHWALAGFRRLHDRGRFEETEANKQAHLEFLRHRSQVKSFIADENWVIDHGPAATNEWIDIENLHNHYIAWCEHYGVNAYYDKPNPFSRELTNKRPDLAPRKKRKTIPDHAGFSEKKTIFHGLQLTTPKDL